MSTYKETESTEDFKNKIAKIKGRNWKEKLNNPLVRKPGDQGYDPPKKELTYEEWVALGADKATEYIAERLFLPPDKKRKLKAILKHQWNEDKTTGSKR